MNLDNNKAISSIIYNYLNLPSVITVTGKGTISYTYDAAGSKIKKVTVEGAKTTTTLYLGGSVFQNDTLQFIAHEEGRIRFNATNNSLSYDYMLKDHLGNVRMVLTEEQQQDVYPAATLENVTYNGGQAVNTESLYYSIDATKIVNQSVATSIPVYQNNNGNPPYNNSPYSNTTANSARLYQLNATTNTNANKNGLGIVLKVMSGDNINIFGKSYHKRPSGSGYTGTTNNIIVTELINAFAGSGIVTSKGVTGTQITGQSGFPANMDGLIGTQPAQSGGRPKAAINWIIFDEQFKWVAGGFDMVGDAGSSTTGTLKSHSILGVPIPKNGYIYVYVSNESKFNVFFDNLQVIHNRGPILEETHYYPFGLSMNVISSKALNFGNPDNKYKFNDGTELNNDFDLSFYESANRLYDPQIGRFLQVDEFAEIAEEWSPYVFAYNNPIVYNDPLGLFGEEPAENGGKVKELQGVTVYSIPNDYWAKMRLFYQIQRYLDTKGASYTQIEQPGLWNMMHEMEGLSRSRTRKAEMTRASDKVVLEGGSWFIPTGWLFKVVKFKKLAALYNLKRGKAVANITEEVVEQTGKHGDEVAEVVSKVSPYELQITHGLTKSKKAFAALKADIKANGIQEPILFVEHNGKKFVVDGHHRLRAAKELGIQNVPVQQTKLPFAGYKTVDDLMYSN